jgi:hypothetical protein
METQPDEEEEKVMNEPIEESIQVAIRIRPTLQNEISSSKTLKFDENDPRTIQIGKNRTHFKAYYDQIFFQATTQPQIFDFIKPGLDQAKEGINVTIMAYGQTGSGKTYTMFGSDWTLNEQSENYIEKKMNIHYDKDNFIQSDFILEPFADSNGIIPRTLLYLTQDKPSNIKIMCSYIQIYNEKIYDLLSDEIVNGESVEIQKSKPTTQEALKIREVIIKKKKQIFIENVTEIELTNFYECFTWLQEGEKQRKIRQTNKNEMSSRSHTIFIIKYINTSTKPPLVSKINLCDLAGSEKHNKNEKYNSIHFSEMVNINQSLITLGIVINELASKKKKKHIPYRNSKLTYLLHDSLGGNTKTFLIATISPSDGNFEETLSTLKFADRAHSVMAKISPSDINISDNYTNEDNAMIKKLTNELNEMKQLLNLRVKRGTIEPLQKEIMKLKEENANLKRYVDNDALQQLIEENKNLKAEIQKLTATKVINDMPNTGYNYTDLNVNNPSFCLSHSGNNEHKDILAMLDGKGQNSSILQRTGNEVIQGGRSKSKGKKKKMKMKRKEVNNSGDYGQEIENIERDTRIAAEKFKQVHEYDKLKKEQTQKLLEEIDRATVDKQKQY